ncbi:MAG: chromosomal replication initiator protein DnaA [Salinispira sp.]
MIKDKNDDYRLFWDEAVKLIQSELTKQDMDLWFSRVCYDSYRDNTIIVSVPSNFHRDQIKARYAQLIETKLSELSNGYLNIEFHISSNPNEKTAAAAVKAPESQPKEKDMGYTRHISAVEKQHPHLKKEYIFDNFVIGENNAFAANATMAIAKNPGTSYNPCSLYGGVGLGKTHLLQSIGNFAYQKIMNLKIVYVTMENFINEFIQSIRNRKTQTFKAKYRHADILLIDDIHFIQRKPETQEELFHTFNALYDSNKQMVFTCDRPISELKDLSERLKSRFSRGLTLDLQPPNYETRQAILNKKIELAGFFLPEESINLICEKITTNVRDLEAALTRLIAYSELVNKPITPQITEQQLKDFFTSNAIHRNVPINIIQQTVAEYFGVSVKDMKGKRRQNKIVIPRQVAMYIARDITEYSTTELGLEFGGRDHTTVMYSCDRIAERMKSDPFFADQVEALKKKVIEANVTA